MSRYIDADKLKEVFDEHEDDYGYLHGYWEEFIDNAPTADVRENVRGEWIEVEVFPEVYDIEGIKTWGSEMQCDQCGFRHTAIEGHMTQYNFCPNCGAEMRGDKKMSNFKEKPKAKNVYYEEHYHTEFKCSLCGATIDCVEGGSMDGAKFNYCPWCGAEMEEEPEI